MNVLLLCDEWGSSKGGLSTFNRLLAEHLARQPTLKVHCYLSEVSEKDRKSASNVQVTLIEAEPVPGTSDAFLKLHQVPPELLHPDIVISHGRKFGTAAYFICKQAPSCKWVHFVHVDCEEMGKYKDNPTAISENEEKDTHEVDLCRKSHFVVAVGPNLECKYDRDLMGDSMRVAVFTPGLINEFLSLKQSDETKDKFLIYVFGRGSSEDFKLKGYDIAANAVARLDKSYILHSVGAPRGEEEDVRQRFLNKTEIKNDRLTVHKYCDDREKLKRLLCKANVVLMPSRAEAFGLIGLEALSAGVPVLVSAASGFGVILKKLPFGDTCVVESDEPEKWAEKIESLRAKTRKVRNDEARVVRTKYGETYNWNNECLKLVEYFRSLTERDSVAANHS